MRRMLFMICIAAIVLGKLYSEKYPKKKKIVKRKVEIININTILDDGPQGIEPTEIPKGCNGPKGYNEETRTD